MATSEPAAATSKAATTSQALITTHTTSPERTVFVESGNHDAWIATDLVVDLER